VFCVFAVEGFCLQEIDVRVTGGSGGEGIATN
jgi:hypothetical protein